MKIFGKNIKPLFIYIIAGLILIDIGLAVWYNFIKIPIAKVSGPIEPTEDYEEAQGWTGFPKINDFKVTAKSPSMNGNYVVAGPWEECKPDRTESRKLKCFSQETGKEVSMDKCKGIDFPKSRSCNYNKECNSTGETSYVCNDCSVAKDGENPCNKGYKCNKEKTECVQNCKSYFKNYPNVGEAFECGCSTTNICPKDYKCMGGICVKNNLISNEFKSSNYCFSGFGSETRKPNGETWCRAFNPRIYTPASGASPVFQSVMSEFLKQNPKEKFDANNPKDYVENKAGRFFNTNYIIPCDKLKDWKSVSPTKEVLDAINQPLESLDSATYVKCKVTVQNFNKQYCVAQKFNDGSYGGISQNMGITYPYCSNCRYNSSNCLVSACKSPYSQGVPGSCNKDGSCDCRPTGGYSGSTCEKQSKCMNNSKTIYESNNHTFKGCDCTKPSSLNKKKDSRVLNFGTYCENTVSNQMCEMSGKLSMPKDWGQGKGYQWLVDSTATIDMQNREKWHNSIPSAKCDGSQGLVKSDIQISCASNQFQSPPFNKKECCMNVCGNNLNLTKKGSQLVKLENFGTTKYFVYRFPGNDPTKPKLGSWDELDLSDSLINDKDYAAALILVSHLKNSEREKYITKNSMGQYVIKTEKVKEDYPAIQFDGCLEECLKVTGAPPIDKEQTQLECNYNLTSILDYNDSTHRDAAMLCACKGRKINPYNKNQCQNEEFEMCLTDKFGNQGTCRNNLYCGNNIDEKLNNKKNLLFTEKDNGDIVNYKLLNYNDSSIFTLEGPNRNFNTSLNQDVVGGPTTINCPSKNFLDLDQNKLSDATQLIVSAPTDIKNRNKISGKNYVTLSQVNNSNNIVDMYKLGFTKSKNSLKELQTIYEPAGTFFTNNWQNFLKLTYFIKLGSSGWTENNNQDGDFKITAIRLEKKDSYSNIPTIELYIGNTEQSLFNFADYYIINKDNGLQVLNFKNETGVAKINVNGNNIEFKDVDSGNTLFTASNSNIINYNKSLNSNSNYNAGEYLSDKQTNVLHYKNTKGNWWPLYLPNINSLNNPTFSMWRYMKNYPFPKTATDENVIMANTPLSTGKDILGRLRPFISSKEDNNNGGYSYCISSNSTNVNHMYPIKMPEGEEKLSTTAPSPYINSNKNTVSGSFSNTAIINSEQPYNIINGNIEDPNFKGTYHKIENVKNLSSGENISSIPSGLYDVKEISNDKNISKIGKATFMMKSLNIGYILSSKNWDDLAQLGFDISKAKSKNFKIPKINNLQVKMESNNYKSWPKNDKNELVKTLDGVKNLKVDSLVLNPIQISFTIPYYSNQIDLNVINSFNYNLGNNQPSNFKNIPKLKALQFGRKNGTVLDTVNGIPFSVDLTDQYPTSNPKETKEFYEENKDFKFSKTNIPRPYSYTSVDNYDKNKANSLGEQNNQIYALPSLTYQDDGGISPADNKLWDSGTYCFDENNKTHAKFNEMCNLSNSPLRQNFAVPLKYNYDSKKIKSNDLRYANLIHSNDIVNSNDNNLKYLLQKKQVPFIPKAEKDSNLVNNLKNNSNFWQPWYNNLNYAALGNNKKASQILTTKNYSKDDETPQYYNVSKKIKMYNIPSEYKQKFTPYDKQYLDHFLEINPLYKSQYSGNNRETMPDIMQNNSQFTSLSKIDRSYIVENGCYDGDQKWDPNFSESLYSDKSVTPYSTYMAGLPYWHGGFNGVLGSFAPNNGYYTDRVIRNIYQWNSKDNDAKFTLIGQKPLYRGCNLGNNLKNFASKTPFGGDKNFNHATSIIGNSNSCFNNSIFSQQLTNQNEINYNTINSFYYMQDNKLKSQENSIPNSKIKYLNEFKGYNNSCSKGQDVSNLSCYLDRIEEFTKGKLAFPYVSTDYKYIPDYRYDGSNSLNNQVLYDSSWLY